MSALRVLTCGSGPDLALLHGWGIGPRAWDAVIGQLATSFRVHLVSLPGYGEPEIRMEKQAQAGMPEESHETFISEPACLKSTIHALSKALPAGCTLCGWSLGAQLAMQAVLGAPGHFARLILVGATPLFTQSEDWPHAQPPALLDSFRASVAQDAAATLQRFAALLNQGDIRGRANTRWLNERIDTFGVDVLTLGLDWLGEIDLRDTVSAITVPTLLIHGANDPLMPLAAAEWTQQRLQDARLEVFDATAHAPFVSDPERFARRVIEFCHE